MIREFTDKFIASEAAVKARLAESPPCTYSDLVRLVVETINEPDKYSSPDPTRITEIDHGDYQGALVYVIGATGYQPYDYWYVRVVYGSCSVCDTLESISRYSSDDALTAEQIQDYWTLALHIAQGLRSMSGELV